MLWRPFDEGRRRSAALGVPELANTGRLEGMAAPPLDEIRKLSVAERLELVEDVIASPSTARREGG